MINLIALLTAAFGLTAHADVGARKEPLRVDFNQMIEEGTRAGRELHQGIADGTAAEPTTDTAAAVAAPAEVAEAPTATARAESPEARRKVIDFIDMEVGVGDNADVVDRR